MTAQILAQVNLGTNYGTSLALLLGILYVVLSVVYLTIMRISPTRGASGANSSANTRYVIQSVALPIFILLCGFILIFHGWRLDPILQFEQLLLFMVIVYLILKDMAMI